MTHASRWDGGWGYSNSKPPCPSARPWLCTSMTIGWGGRGGELNRVCLIHTIPLIDKKADAKIEGAYCLWIKSKGAKRRIFIRIKKNVAIIIKFWMRQTLESIKICDVRSNLFSLHQFPSIDAGTHNFLHGCLRTWLP